MSNLQGKILIADFMEYPEGFPHKDDSYGLQVLEGYEIAIHINHNAHEEDENKHQFTMEQLAFDSEWNWIMPVLDKIEDMGNDIHREYFWNKDDDKQHNDFLIFRVQDIKELFNQVVEFLEWCKERNLILIKY